MFGQNSASREIDEEATQTGGILSKHGIPLKLLLGRM